MKVLFVGNSLYYNGNGLAKSARVTMERLRNAGLEVRSLSMAGDENMPKPDYVMPMYHFPVFQKLVVSHSYYFAVSNMDQIREAVAWADIIHMEEPFVLEHKVGKEARRQGKACVGTYHVHTDNITRDLGMRGWKLPANLLLRNFIYYGYNYCSDLQCPSQNAMERFSGYGYKGDMYCISNGIELEENVTVSEPQTNPYLIVCIGRFTNDKSTHTLLEAMLYCRNRSQIQLFFAGKGENEAKLKRMAAKLVRKGVIKYEPEFEFCSKTKLRELARKAYLAVHCAVVEVEGLSIMEAVSQGTVPVVAEGPLTAAPQFTLSPESRFPVQNAKALAERIDWWIEHPEKRMEYAPKYIEAMKQYDVHNSISQLIEMYKKAIDKVKK